MELKKILFVAVPAAMLLLSKRARASGSANFAPGMIGKYFSFDELIDSPTCEHAGIDNMPNAEQIDNARAVVYNLLDPIREHIGRPLFVNSFFRGHDCNQEIGGADESKHLDAMAADVATFVDGERRNELILNAVKNLDLDFDRIILEYGTLDNPQWVHIEYDRTRNEQRRQILRIDDSGTNYLSTL